MKIVMSIAMLIATLGMSMMGAAPASAHTPGFSADCAGVHVKATAYDSGQQNQWSVTIGGVTQSGTFGSSFSQTFPVPQDGAATSWSAFVVGHDGKYRGQDSGTVGPCGTPPPPTDVCADLPGDQPTGTSCTPPPPTDVCADLPGDQPTGTSCTPPAGVVRADGKELDGCDVTFDGTPYGAGSLTYDEQFTDTTVFNASTNTWDVVTDTTATVANLEFTPWSLQEQVAAGCTEQPTQPPAVQTSESTNNVVCGQDVVVTTTVASTTPYVYDAQTNGWVLGEPAVTTTTSESPVTPEDCDETETSVVPTEEQPVFETVNVVSLDAPNRAPQVPTAINAGLGGSDVVAPQLSAASATTSAVAPAGDRGLPALLLMMGAALALVGGLKLRKS